jgi:hypothetical protein
MPNPPDQEEERQKLENSRLMKSRREMFDGKR